MKATCKISNQIYCPVLSHCQSQTSACSEQLQCRASYLSAARPQLQSLVRASAISMQCLLILPALFVLSMSAPHPPIWWNVEDWADDLHYNLTHMNAGGPLGFGILGSTPHLNLDFWKDSWA